MYSILISECKQYFFGIETVNVGIPYYENPNWIMYSLTKIRRKTALCIGYIQMHGVCLQKCKKREFHVIFGIYFCLQIDRKSWHASKHFLANYYLTSMSADHIFMYEFTDLLITIWMEV